MATSHAERLASLEVHVSAIRERQERYDKHWKEVNGKLDELLSLRNKGIGAFWLASILTGTGIIGALGLVLDWWKGVLYG